MEGLADFIFKLFEEIREEQLWDIWISQPFKEQSFEEWKKEVDQPSSRYRALSKEEEERNIKFATQFIKPINDEEGGGTNNE